MAPIKRKNESVSTGTRPEKRRKPSSTAQPSILVEEEPAFPRGGASVLTPLEHKQIQIQAKQDVLFEQSTGRRAATNDYENGDDASDENLPAQQSEPTVKSKGKRKAKGEKTTVNGNVEEQGVRVEGLSFKVSSPWHLNDTWLTFGLAACSWLDSLRAGVSDQQI